MIIQNLCILGKIAVKHGIRGVPMNTVSKEGIRCKACIWRSDGFNDPKGSGYCYSTGDYVSDDGLCGFFQTSLRPEPVNEPEAQLIQNVRAMDTEVEG